MLQFIIKMDNMKSKIDKFADQGNEFFEMNEYEEAVEIWKIDNETPSLPVLRELLFR